MKTYSLARFGVVVVVGLMLMLAGCESKRESTVQADGPEVVLAVAVDHGTATSESNAHRVLLSRNGEAAVGWSRNPSSMRKFDRLTEGQKTDILRAAGSAMNGARPGEYAFGSKDGDWIRVVIMTSKRRLIFDESAKKNASPPPAEVRLIVDALVNQADR